MNDKTLIFCSLSVLLTASHIFMATHTILSRRSLLEALREHKDYLDLEIEAIRTEAHEFAEKQEGDILTIHERLATIDEKASAQFREVAGIKRTYDGILEESKKKTVDTTAQDTAIMQIKKEAEQYYSEKNYALAYKAFKTVVTYQPDDFESRLKKMKSLYYKNRADGSNYHEILDDIRILRSGGYSDAETDDIENSIIAEREGLNE